MFNLGFFGSHNATIAISKGNKILEAVELERFTSKKNCALWFYYNIPEPYNINVIHEIKNYFEEKYDVTEYDTVLYNSVKDEYYKIFPAKQYKFIQHHTAHAYSAFYQSPYNNAIIISADGGSDEGYFNIFLADRRAGVTKIHSGKKDLAVPYALIGHYIQDIKHEELFWGNLVYAGKLMGFANYGKPRKEYVDLLYKLYNNGDSGDILKTKESILTIFGIDDSFRFIGDDAKDLAASNQFVFESIFEEESLQFLNAYPNLPVILVGGCALNILNNTKLAKTREVFVPPNPNDCGIAVGLLAFMLKPDMPIDCTYLGSKVWDRNKLTQIAYERNGKPLDIKMLAEYISAGKIVGIVRGNGEHGPRALGNRSIICDPSTPNMKDILNAKIKGREWYRPFAPVVRLEDVNKYFNWNKESRWMSFCPEVKNEFKEKLAAITHVDGTARVQTVTREQNEFLYNLLTELHNKTGIGVLLNTSFNVDGRPILNTYEDALWVLDNKNMDAVVFEDYIIFKHERRLQV
jgi:carbamoyltransferase